ncbi:uracil-DNA glycosylase [Ignicoccus hospitalis]|uniref:Type-4 uracil-DNA glycosylase n=1 Tax=Ignicoccus hospitalis (strain KIN4/I / DSM 18386 / JCM 14125) TaxID=453591 RepID=A8A982_IGNH4|nr:uracil-DNA glycosylase [Ignicoccus hospitalis]ABU81484.1 phage SPO1 DNA polymerase-related protein [Ignicoccus hospitalis KIN4/I]HIH90208.1 uracil-DNA glycosylase [Desulfurococcaceae archaeon]
MCLREVAEKVKGCCKCDLCKVRKNPVPGEGDEGAEVVFVGEAPGKEEDEEGRPFVGRAGRLLRSTISQIGFKKYYITNVVKCRPPGNRTPTEEEVEACKPYLIEELNCIRPKLVVALGRTAAEALLGLKGPLKGVRGKVLVASAGGARVKVLVTYHPAAVLRNPKLKEQFVSDLKKAFNEVYKQRSLFDSG